MTYDPADQIVANRASIAAKTASLITDHAVDQHGHDRVSRSANTDRSTLPESSPIQQAAAANGADLERLLDSAAFARRLGAVGDINDADALGEAIRQTLVEQPHLATAHPQPRMKPNPAQGRGGAPVPTQATGTPRERIRQQMSTKADAMTAGANPHHF